MDFGVNHRAGLPSPLTSHLVIRRCENKDSRKRWNADKVQFSKSEGVTVSLKEALSTSQPSLAVIAGRAQADPQDQVVVRRSRHKISNKNSVPAESVSAFFSSKCRSAV
mmetsp:Transcript_4002/g.11574  ORF Transcript_4002/g.11574 Transcript_4002/m.11574 type:complete len:109 (+) Transcript_4002:467-793(+)